MSIAERIAEVEARIGEACRRAGRDPASVHLVAISKTHPAASIREAKAAGLLDFGENRVQEALPKIETLGREGLVWHLVGHLQSNKAARAVQNFDLIHTIDSLALAREVDRRAGEISKVQRILIQVNASGETSKSGCRPEELPAIARDVVALPSLGLEGLMTIGPLDPDPESARPAFRKLQSLRDQVQELIGRELPHLSMGMTGDLEVAIEEGATLIRVGTAIFGERPAG